MSGASIPIDIVINKFLADPIGQSNYQTVLALCYVVVLTGTTYDINATIIAALDKSPDGSWACCLDRRQVWNQKRSPWFEAVLYFVYPVLDPIVHMLLVAVQTGATMYQAMALAISCLTEMWDCLPDCLYTIAVALGDILPTDCKPLGASVLIQILFAALYTKLLETIKIEADSGADSVAVANDDTSRSSICNALAEAICSIDEDNKHTEAIEGLIRMARESQRSTVLSDDDDDEDGSTGGDEAGGLSFVSTVKVDDVGNGAAAAAVAWTPSTRTAEEYDVDNAEYIAELLASDVLATFIGKQCLKILYAYLRCNAEWLLQQLGVSDVPHSRLQPLAGQSMREQPIDLLTQMFHIGRRPFDQLLTTAMRIDYARWLQTPMSMTPERAWLQIGKRPEFQDGVRLSVQDTVMVAAVAAKCK